MSNYEHLTYNEARSILGACVQGHDVQKALEKVLAAHDRVADVLLEAEAHGYLKDKITWSDDGFQDKVREALAEVGRQ